MNKEYLAQIDFQNLIPAVFPNVTGLPAKTNATIADLLSLVLQYVYIIAGIILFFFLVIAGFSYLTAGGDAKKIESAKGKIGSALTGFIIIFIAYWLTQLVELIFGIKIL